MSEITVNIDDYITEDEKRNIARSAFHAVCVQKSKEDFERILSNSAYDLVQSVVDDAMDGSMVETIKVKAIDVIKELGAYSVFKPKDAWHKDESKGWVHLQAALDANKHLINDRVEQIIQELGAEQIRELLEDRLLDALVDRITRSCK